MGTLQAAAGMSSLPGAPGLLCQLQPPSLPRAGTQEPHPSLERGKEDYSVHYKAVPQSCIVSMGFAFLLGTLQH